MAGQIKIPGSIWQSKRANGKPVWKVEVDLGVDADGKRRRTRRTVATRAEATRVREELWLGTRGARSGLALAPNETFKEYAKWWLQNVKRGRIRESTLGDYEYRLSHWVYPAFGRRRLADIKARDVEQWMHDLRSRRGLALSTVNGARTVLGEVLKYAHNDGKISLNPVALTEPLRAQYGDSTLVQAPWSLDEVKAALQAVRDTPFDLFVTLGVAYGLRRGEALGLHWDDIDFEAGTLSVNRGLKQARLVDADGAVTIRIVEDAPKTSFSRRTLPLSALALGAFHRHKAMQQAMRTAAGGRWVETDLVFTSSVGTHVSPSNLRRGLRKQLAAHQVRLIRIHDMRHTAAVQALEGGERIESVSQVLGHSDIRMTKAIYAPQVDSLSSSVASTLSDRFGGSLEQEHLELYSTAPDKSVA